MHATNQLKNRYDFILVGGGLQNGLIALSLSHEQPDKTYLIIERDGRLAGNHTWCFHGSDIPKAAEAWFQPIVEHRWPGYTVDYPGFSRHLDMEYCGISSSHFHDYVQGAVTASPNGDILLKATVATLGTDHVILNDETRINGDCIIDARGPSSAPRKDQGYQKFVGLELELDTGHGLTHPVLMDGCIPQTDGLRFFYALPFGPRHVLVEDTYFSDDERLNIADVRDEIFAYAKSRNWHVKAVIREESGVLPLPWSEHEPEKIEGILMAGYGGGYFHPVTGYSLPAAIRLAIAIGQSNDQETRQYELNQLNEHLAGQRRYLNRLNHVFFRHYEPEDRWHLMARFYRRPKETIKRFYSMNLTGWDIMRILIGPIPKKMRWTARGDVSGESV